MNESEPAPDEAPSIPPPNAPDPLAPVVERLAHIETALKDHFGEMRGLSRDALRSAHEETERQRNVAALGALRPLLNELLAVHDDLSRLIEHYSGAPAADPKDVAANLDGLRTELDEIFERRGVVPLRPLAPKFDRDTQRAVHVLPAEIASDDMAVVGEVRIGFHGPGGVVRRADVAIRRFAPDPQAPEAT